MKRTVSAVVVMLLCAVAAQAADKKIEAPKNEGPTAAAVSVQAPAPTPAGESEKSKDWKGLLAQEQWVARLKKQIEGETKQLSEMRAQVAEKFKLDPKKLDAGAYTYDEKKDAFVERS